MGRLGGKGGTTVVEDEYAPPFRVSTIFNLSFNGRNLLGIDSYVFRPMITAFRTREAEAEAEAEEAETLPVDSEA